MLLWVKSYRKPNGCSISSRSSAPVIPTAICPTFHLEQTAPNLVLESGEIWAVLLTSGLLTVGMGIGAVPLVGNGSSRSGPRRSRIAASLRVVSGSWNARR